MAFSFDKTDFSSHLGINNNSLAGKRFTSSGGGKRNPLTLNSGFTHLTNPLTGFIDKFKSQFTTADDVVKPGLSDDVLQRLALLRPPVEQGDAEIRWGKPSKFQINEPDQPDQITYTTVVNTTTTITPDPPPGSDVFYYDEFKRKEHKVRIENPDDSEQWVEDAVMDWIIFQSRQTGAFEVFILKPPD